MNIQIFGTSKCFDTKKAQRYFKERGIKFQMIDLKEKEMSRGEFENVARALGGWEKLVDPNAKDKQTLALLDALVCHEFDLLSAMLFDKINSSNSRTTCSKHRICNNDQTFRDWAWQFGVVFVWLMCLLITIQTNMTNLCSRD